MTGSAAATKLGSSSGTQIPVGPASGKQVQTSKEANKYIKKLEVHVMEGLIFVSKLSSLYSTTGLCFVQGPLLQPSRKHYGGMGCAKESIFLQLNDPGYAEKCEAIWEEHIPGFSGKVRLC